MAEIGFYHLTRSSAEQALPRLLGRTLDLGKRALVRCRDEARASEIDEALWRAPGPVWLPHGTARLGHAYLQPVWIEGGASAASGPAANGADYLFLLDGSGMGEGEMFERVFDLFDGGDEAALAAARIRWSRLKQAGHGLAYWKQAAQGWQKAGSTKRGVGKTPAGQETPAGPAVFSFGEMERHMQDDTKPSGSLDPDATPSSHDQLNRPGMTNGVPDQAGDAQAKGRPHNDREQAEAAAAGTADGAGDGIGEGTGGGGSGS